jgi:hypothetical protein
VIVALVGAGFLVQRRLTQPVPTVRLVAAIGVAALVAGVGAFALQRHYFHRRYLVGSTARPLSDLYRWAQGVSNARIAVYGSVEQYPLYGARDTNRVTYLGQHLGNGGFAPIRSCSLWRRTLAAGHYQYVVLSPGPTPPVPLEWTQGIRGATIVARPAYAYVALHLARPSERPSACS